MPTAPLAASAGGSSFFSLGGALPGDHPSSSPNWRSPPGLPVGLGAVAPGAAACFGFLALGFDAAPVEFERLGVQAELLRENGGRRDDARQQNRGQKPSTKTHGGILHQWDKKS